MTSTNTRRAANTPRRFLPLLAISTAASLALAVQPAPSQPAPSQPPRKPATPAQRVVKQAGDRLLEQADVQRNIEYAKVGDRSLKLDLYRPRHSDTPTPVIIWVHGGGWEQGSKDVCPAIPMLAEGFAAVSVQYRLTDAAPFPAQIHDVKAAVRWLRAHAEEYNLDPDRFGAWGASAGGHLVALLGTSGGDPELEGDEGVVRATPEPGAAGAAAEIISSRVRCVCDFFGPTDMTTFPGMDNAPPTNPVYKLMGGPPSQKHDLMVQASPITYITADDPPFLIMHGDKDDVVPLDQSQRFDELLRKAGIRSELVVLKGQGHGFKDPEPLKKVRAFFLQELKPAPPTPPAAPASPSPAPPASTPAPR